jgi:hypothetical protein
MDHHTVAAISITGTCLDVLGSLYLAYDLLGGQHGPLRLLTRAVTYSIVFGVGYGLGLGLSSPSARLRKSTSVIREQSPRCQEFLQIRLPICHAHLPTQVLPLGRANSPSTALPAWSGEFAIARGDHGTTRNLLVGKIANGR